MKYRFLVSSALILTLTACGSSGDERQQAFSVDASTIAASPWPLVIPSVTIDCSIQPYLVGQHDGKSYAMTGSSISKAERDKTGWTPILDVAVQNPDLPEIKMDISPINEYAIDKCKQLGFWK